jgi:hypothetical protein
MSNFVKKRRRLTDLYMVGKELTFSDSLDENNEDDPVTVWINKLSPIEQRDAADQATKARATILTIKNSPSLSADRLMYEDQIYDLGIDTRELQVEFLASEKIQEAEISNEERIASEDEWSKDQYLKSLQESWNDGLLEKWTDDPEDEDAKKVYDELKRFAEQVIEATKDDRENILAEYEHVSDDEIFKDVVDKIIDAEADFAWMNEFAGWQVYYAVREVDDHKTRYFESREEVACLDNRILTEIVRQYREMTVEGVEGKG